MTIVNNMVSQFRIKAFKNTFALIWGFESFVWNHFVAKLKRKLETSSSMGVSLLVGIQ